MRPLISLWGQKLCNLFRFGSSWDLSLVRTTSILYCPHVLKIITIEWEGAMKIRQITIHWISCLSNLHFYQISGLSNLHFYQKFVPSNHLIYWIHDSSNFSLSLKLYFWQIVIYMNRKFDGSLNSTNWKCNGSWIQRVRNSTNRKLDESWFNGFSLHQMANLWLFSFKNRSTHQFSLTDQCLLRIVVCERPLSPACSKQNEIPLQTLKPQLQEIKSVVLMKQTLYEIQFFGG